MLLERFFPQRSVIAPLLTFFHFVRFQAKIQGAHFRAYIPGKKRRCPSIRAQMHIFQSSDHKKPE